MNRLLCAIVLGLSSAVAAQAAVVDTLVACKELQIKTSRIDPYIVKLRWTCPTRPAVLPLPGTTTDPTTGPVSALFLHAATGPAYYLGTYSLPQAGWKRSGPPGNPREFRFSGVVNGSTTRFSKCRVSISASGVSAKCTVYVNAPLPVLYPLAVTLITSHNNGNQQQYCAAFGGTELANDAKSLVRVNSPAPAACAPQ